MNSINLTLPNEYTVVRLACKVMGSVDRAVVPAIGFVQLYADPFSNSERCRANETNNAASLRNMMMVPSKGGSIFQSVSSVIKERFAGKVD